MKFNSVELQEESLYNISFYRSDSTEQKIPISTVYMENLMVQKLLVGGRRKLSLSGKR